MNIFIENYKDFYNILNNNIENNNTENNDTENKNNHICLLSHLQLDLNYITLKCNHKFNYSELYNEVLKQKTYNSLEITYLKINEIKCPYCRSITPNLLPYFKNYNFKLIRGVNYPTKYCMKIHDCDWVFKNGKNKNNKCCSSAFIENGLKYCQYHHDLNDKQILNNLLKNSKNDNTHNTDNTDNTDNLKNKLLKRKLDLKPSNEEESKIFKKYNVNFLKNFLKKNNQKVSGTKIDLVKRIIDKKILLE